MWRKERTGLLLGDVNADDVRRIVESLRQALRNSHISTVEFVWKEIGHRLPPFKLELLCTTLVEGREAAFRWLSPKVEGSLDDCVLQHDPSHLGTYKAAHELRGWLPHVEALDVAARFKRISFIMWAYRVSNGQLKPSQAGLERAISHNHLLLSQVIHEMDRALQPSIEAVAKAKERNYNEIAEWAIDTFGLNLSASYELEDGNNTMSTISISDEES